MNFRILTCALIVLATFSSGFAQTPADISAIQSQIEALKAEYEGRIKALEDQVQALQSQIQSSPKPETAELQQTPGPQPTAAVPAGAQGAGGPTAPLPVYGGASSKVFNPDIAVLGDFQATGGSNKLFPQPAMEMHESEASFQAVVDPYARADFFFSFSEHGVDLEEGYATFPAIPGGLLVRAGKMRAAFGKVNTMHNHVLPWVDRPLMTMNLVGGEEGISDAGVSVARLIPNPWIFLEATGQLYRGDSSDVFKSFKPAELAYVGHLRGYGDISESTNVDLGVSYARGHNGSALLFNSTDLTGFHTSLYGTDATIHWRPLKRSIYHSFVGRTELVWSKRQQPNGLQNGFGYYVSGDYQFARRWFAGLRYDHSAHADDAALVDKGQSAILTYWPSEFSQLRAQYRRTQYAVGPTANEILMQLQFAIGAHGAHPF